MRKLAPARVSYRDDFFISYRVMIGSFHISLFEGTLHTVARFRTGVKFSPRYNKRGELTPG